MPVDLIDGFAFEFDNLSVIISSASIVFAKTSAVASILVGAASVTASHWWYSWSISSSLLVISSVISSKFCIRVVGLVAPSSSSSTAASVSVE